MIADPAGAYALAPEDPRRRERYFASAHLYGDLPDSSFAVQFALIDSVKPGRKGTTAGVRALAAAAGVAISTAHAALKSLAGLGLLAELKPVRGRTRRAPALPRGSGRHVRLSGPQVDAVRAGLAERRLSGWDLQLLLFIVDRRGEDGPNAACGFPRHEIARLLKTSRARVSRGVRALAAAGLLRVDRRPARRWILTPIYAPLYAHPRGPSVTGRMSEARRLAGQPRPARDAAAAARWVVARVAASRGRKPNGGRGRKPNGPDPVDTAFALVGARFSAEPAAPLSPCRAFKNPLYVVSPSGPPPAPLTVAEFDALRPAEQARIRRRAPSSVPPERKGPVEDDADPVPG